MNKLVSRNPVQKFKQGRKIVKALGGLPMVINTGGTSPKTVRGVPAVRNTVGGVPSTVSKTTNAVSKVGRGLLGRAGSFLGRIAGPIGAYLLASDMEERRKEIADKLNSGEYTFSNGKLVKNEAASGASIGNVISHPVNRQTAINKLLKTGNYILDKNGNLVKKSTNTTNNKASTPKSLLKTQEQWNTEFQNNFINNLTQDQRQYLDSQGVNFNDVKAVQKFIGTNDDGKWGKNSINAWNKFISTIPQNFSQTREEQSMMQGTTPYVETPITPTKYTTNNTYMDKTQFRDNIGGLGIQSNADLINWMHQTGAEGYDFGGNQWAKQFRSDVDRALGGDYSDTNIRKTFNTAGNWGRGFLGGGDLSDFQNAMATNAGVWNGIADAGKQPTIQFDRSATREWLRNNAGGSAYAFTGDQRKAVRNILNGQGTDQDKELIKGNADLAKALTGYFKTGGTMNILPSRNIVERFKQGRKITFAQNGVSFKDAWNQARANKQRYFNWNGRMYNSKAAGNDTEYESFVDNMNEMSALLPTDRQPKHLGWERNNPTSSEVRGNDREIKKDGTENTLTEIIVSGKKKSKKSKPSAKIVTNKNKASRNMSGTWGQGSGGGQQYANQRQYAFERSAFDKMRTSSSSIFGSTAYKTDNRGRRYVERDGSLYYDDGTYYNPQTRKTGKYTYTPGGLFSRNLFTQY